MQRYSSLGNGDKRIEKPSFSPLESIKSWALSSEVGGILAFRKSTNPKSSVASKLQQFHNWKVNNAWVGWRFSLKAGVIASAAVFLINLAVTIPGFFRPGRFEEGTAVLMEGECAKVRWTNITVHLYMNIASTILLSAANFSMQCLSAPTRSDVDRAHEKRVWLDIGIPSLRNVPFISRRNIALWMCLAATSLVHHLLLNATVFLTIGTYSYDIYTVQPGTFEHSGTAISVYLEPDAWKKAFPYYDDVFSGPSVNTNDAARRNATLSYHNRDECIDLFAQAFVTDRRFVILELDEPVDLPDTPYHNLLVDAMAAFSPVPDCPSVPDSWICAEKPREACQDQCEGTCHFNAHSWTCNTSNTEYCSSGCDISHLKSQARWAPFADEWNVSGCYSQKLDEYCKVEMASQLATVVLIVTLFHFLFLFLSLYTLSTAPLLSIGDAIASFLQRPDAATRNTPFLQLSDAAKPWLWTPVHRYWHPLRIRKLHAIGRTRRLSFTALFVTILALLSTSLGLGIARVKRRDASLNPFSTGIGAGVNTNTLLRIASESLGNGPSSVIWSTTLLANAGQPLLSLLHWAYNALFTAVYLGREWDGYGGEEKKGLRVAAVPRGVQRATHFLQLPWRYGVPLSAASAALHWLASQSVFTVSLTSQGVGGGSRDRGGGGSGSNRFIGCGFSPLAMVLLIAALLLLLVVFLAAALPRLKNGMPVVGSCSVAIAAACHRPSASPDAGDRLEDISAMALRWGVVDSTSDGEVRCGFTPDDDVAFPARGSMPFGLWQVRVLEALREQDLVDFVDGDAVAVPSSPELPFSNRNAAVDMRGIQELCAYRRTMREWKARNDGRGREGKAQMEILNRMMGNAWGVRARYGFSNAREIWDSFEDRFGESHEDWHQ